MSTYQSVQTVAWASSTTAVITKPTSLAVGDLMMAILVNQTGVTSDWTGPSGWTSYANTTILSSGTEMRLTVMYKVAEASDVSASNFTFTQSQNVSRSGAILRITNFGFIDQTAKTDFFNTTTTLSPITGITPTKINELLLMIVVGGESSGTDPTYSGYSIATSNPSWTEIFDLSNSSGTTGFACAVATRPEITATGNGSITLDTYPTGGDYIVRIISLAPRVDGSATPSAIANTYFRVPPHIQPIKNVSFATLESTSTSRNKITWTNETKPTTTWTNETL